MENETHGTVAFLGGDARMRLLARMLEAEGRRVVSWGLEGAPEPRAFCDALRAERVILPLPMEQDGKLTGTELTTMEVLRALRPAQRIYAGGVRRETAEAARALGLHLTDYLAREELSVRNAIPTAEGALETAMRLTGFTLHGAPCLVLGFGRIGKLLAHDLAALGARVTVSARKLSDLAWIDAFGYASLPMRQLSGALGAYRVVFNTVPHEVLDGALLEELPPECLLIELAGASGFDLTAVERLHLRYCRAGGLPGRVAPETAALAIKTTLLQLWEEEEK